MRWTKPFGLLLVLASVMVYTYVFKISNVSAGSLSLSGGHAELLSSNPIKVDRLDASADRIIPADARLEKIADGFTWVEGPIWVKDSLFFAEIPSDSIRKWTPDAGVRIFLKPSGYQGTAPYGGPESGSNGMTLDRLGRLTVAGIILGVCLLAVCTSVLAVGRFGMNLNIDALRTLSFIVLVFSGQATIYAIREHRHLWGTRPSLLLALASIVDVLIASTLAVGGIAMTRLPASLVAATLAAAVAFSFVLDLVKIPVFAHLLARPCDTERSSPKAASGSAYTGDQGTI